MSELIMSGLNLMVMGMGTVFVFLTVLVLGTTVMSQIIIRLPSTSEAETNKTAPRNTSHNEDLAEVAAVAAVARLVHHR